MKKICFVFLLLLTLIPLGVSAQQQMIQGRVLDDKGESIIGASVSVRGTVTGGITNLDGEFSVAGKVGHPAPEQYKRRASRSFQVVTKLVR